MSKLAVWKNPDCVCILSTQEGKPRPSLYRFVTISNSLSKPVTRLLQQPSIPRELRGIVDVAAPPMLIGNGCGRSIAVTRSTEHVKPFYPQCTRPIHTERELRAENWVLTSVSPPFCPQRRTCVEKWKWKMSINMDLCRTDMEFLLK